MTTPSMTQHRWRIVLWAVMLTVVALLLWRARTALLPFALGGVIAYALTPVVDRLASLIPARSRRGDVLRRGLVVFVLYAIAGTVLFAAAVALAPAVVNQTTHFVDTLPELVVSAREQSDDWLARYRSRIPADQQGRFETLVSDGTGAVGLAIGRWMGSSVGFLTQTLTWLFALLVVPVWMFWALRDRHFVATSFKNAVPAALRPDVENVLAIADGLMGRYIRGQLFLGLVVGLGVGLGLTLLRVQLSLALGIWAGVTELIPILGPWIGAIPGLIIVLATDPGKFVWVALLYLVVQQLENNLLVPRIQGNAVNIHPAMVLILLAIGGTIAGFLGLLVIIPLTAIVRELFWYADRRLRGEPPDVAFRLTLIGQHLRSGDAQPTAAVEAIEAERAAEPTQVGKLNDPP